MAVLTTSPSAAAVEAWSTAGATRRRRNNNTNAQIPRTSLAERWDNRGHEARAAAISEETPRPGMQIEMHFGEESAAQNAAKLPN